MAGIYIHIPYCRKACHYCDFHFSTQLGNLPEMTRAMLRELELRRDYLEHHPVETIYFGGGTPSVLGTDDILRMVETVHRYWNVAPDAEVTLEANPDDLKRPVVRAWMDAGINRLSMGIQSFREADLVLMNRSHTAAQGEYAVKLAQDAGINNITVDLIYSIPGLSVEDWRTNVYKAVALDVPHLSAYSLTIEERTVFAHMRRTGAFAEVPDEISASHYQVLTDILADKGFRHYEVSNFARPGWESRHNGAYWEGKWYLGIGPSAHSFNGAARQWNVANNARYIRSISEGRLDVEAEELDTRTRLNEYLMTGLRRDVGVDTGWIRSEFGVDVFTRRSMELDRWMAAGHLRSEGSRLYLTEPGLLYADAVASDLFITESEWL